MKRFRAARVLAVLALLAASFGCRSGAKDDPILRLSAAESLAEGKQLFEREKYAAARPYFAHAFEVEPNSAAGREALLLVADTLFLEGSDTDLIQAEAKYRDFQNRFPTSERSDYVQYQIARSLARRIERADRDQAATVKALQAFEDLLRLYPTSPHAEEARAEIATVRDRLAEHEYVVGQFYLRYGLHKAAIARLNTLLERYPGYGERDKALWALGMSHAGAKAADDAQATFSKLRDEFPQSRWLAKVPKEYR
ncbi:MAG: outer membrane protein assembly factor BamD [Thermoanaerobaculia bacterium]|nr:MAG: outer membrane protein assembly factor BamD [Thermoanaerobaculia bacterium]